MEAVVEERFEKPGFHGHLEGSLVEELTEAAIEQAECLACYFEGDLIRSAENEHCFY